jgi:hypothetical protein
VEKEPVYFLRPYLPATRKMQARKVDIIGVLLEEEKSSLDKRRDGSGVYLVLVLDIWNLNE